MKNIKVLIVEDDTMVSFLHKALLQKNKIAQDPLIFKNGQEAWDFLVNDDPDEFYLILLDLNMPVLNGWQFLDKLKEKNEISNRVKVAIVTSSINPEDNNKARDYDVVDYFLSKPLLDFTEIKKAMEDLKKITFLKE